jgi:gliding motility-associated-like protein
VLTTTGSQVNVLCNGLCNGSATVNPSGGTPGYTFAWAPSGGNASTASGLCAGNYTCTVTDANGCTTTRSFAITQPPALFTTMSTVSATCGNPNGNATVTVGGGTPTYSYNWSPAPGGGQGTATATGLAAGTYVVTVTDLNGCTITATATIVNTGGPTVTITSSANVSCFNGADGFISCGPAGGNPPYTYNWSPAPGGGQGTPMATGLIAGTYVVTVTDANGCTATATATITQPTALTLSGSQTSVSCNGGCNGSATITASGGTPGYNYSWAPSGGNAPTATGLCAGLYTVTVTDANGCVATQQYSITQPGPISATTSFVSATCGMNNGSATVSPSGGTPGYTYQWSSGGTNPTEPNLFAGTYTCTVTDANLCTFTITVTVPNSGSPTATITAFTNVTCFGACDGTATVLAGSGAPPYTYAWTPLGGNGTNATGLCPGSYMVTVTDANSCTATATVLITEPPQLTLSTSQVDILCNGNTTGSANVMPSGGVPPYTYSWSSGGIGATETGLGAGPYTVTVTDDNGCIATASVTITEPPALTLAAAGFNVTCNGACDGQVVVIPSGGTPNYTFNWSTGCTNPSCNNICAGTYNVTVTDMNGCTASATTTVTEPLAITTTTSSVDAHCNQADGSASASASGGSGTLTYQWLGAGGPATPNYNNILPGTYTVVVTDGNSCTDTAFVTVNNIPGVTATPGTSTNVSCFGVCDGTAICNVTGGTGTINYTWLPTGGNTANATGLCAGPYTCTVTDSAGCTSTMSVTITEPPQLTLTASAVPAAVCEGQSVTLSSTAGGGTPGYQYLWQPTGLPGSSQTFVPSGTLTHTVDITDANGCTASATVQVTVNPMPVAALSGDVLSGCAPLCVNFTDNSTGGAATSWLWDFGDGNTSTLQNPNHCYNVPGPYTVILTVTTANGCTNTITMANYINVFANPVAAFTAGPQPTTELNPLINFTDQSTGADTWSWSFGDVLNSSSTLQHPSFEYPSSGCYDVTLTVTTVNGCVSSTVDEICIDPDVTLFVPNAFTPNADGSNDMFFPQGIGIDPDQFEMWIFDRWGNLIYYTEDMSQGWNGCVQGSSVIAQIDTYVWKIKAVDMLGKKHSLIGKVSLIR